MHVLLINNHFDDGSQSMVLALIGYLLRKVNDIH